LGKDPLAAEAYAETNVGSFWNYLLLAQDEDEQRGISRVFEAIDPMARTLRWCSAPGAEMVRRAIRLRHRAVVLKMIDSLSDRQYEALACVSLNLAGASKFVLTPKGNEGGVDFFALLPSPARCHLFSGAHHPLRIIGQSKKYTSAVQAGKFKEFLKTIDEVKHGGEPKTEKVIPPWFHSVRGPIVGLMIAHYGFQSGATTRARRHGVILADSLDLAELIAMSRGINESLPGEARADECRSRVQALLS
jgi:hypothetical protein